MLRGGSNERAVPTDSQVKRVPRHLTADLLDSSSLEYKAHTLNPVLEDQILVDYLHT